MASRIVDRIDCLPELEFDADGFPEIPNRISESRRKQLTEIQRKVRFLVAYNAFCGNVTLALIDAGVKRPVYKKWQKDDKEFVDKMDEIKDEIADRLLHIMNMRMGAVKPTEAFKNAKISDYVLLTALKAVKPSLFEDDGQAKGVTISLNIPRPDRPLAQGDNAALSSAREAGSLSHQPS